MLPKGVIYINDEQIIFLLISLCIHITFTLKYDHSFNLNDCFSLVSLRISLN